MPDRLFKRSGGQVRGQEIWLGATDSKPTVDSQSPETFWPLSLAIVLKLLQHRSGSNSPGERLDVFPVESNSAR